MGFSREDCEYTKFNIENHKIEFADSGEHGVLISIPFADDTPQCIKDKLNDIIYQSMKEWSKTEPDMDIPKSEKLLLCVRMQVLCHNDKELSSQYYISVVITDPIEYCIDIDKTVNIFSETSNFRNDFISYCQYQVNKILFPFR